MRAVVPFALSFVAYLATPAAADHHAVGSHAFDARLEVDKATFMVGEPVYATVVYRGDVEIEESWMNQNRLARPANYQVELVRDGKALRVPDAGPQMGGQSWTVKLDAKHEQRTRILLSSWFEGLTPGHYTVKVSTKMRARQIGTTAWQTEAIAVEIPVDVVADDSAALGRIITALGDRAVKLDDDSREATSQLTAVTDPRAVAQWVRVAAVADYEHKILAVWGLQKFTTDAALDTIIAVSKTVSADLPADRYTTNDLRDESAAQLRVAAAQALGATTSARGWPALLAMRTDKYASVRLTVAQRAAKQPAKEARPLLTQFLNDPDATVAGEARRLLDALP